MRKVALFLSVLALLLIGVVVVGAQDDAAEEEMDMVGNGYVRFIHLSPDAGPVDVFLNGNDPRGSLAGLSNGEFSGWIVVDSGDLEITVRPEGRSAVLLGGPITVPIAPDDRLTVVVTGSRFDGELKANAIFEDYTEIQDNFARVTLFHGIEGLGPVDILNDGELFLGRLAYPGDLVLEDGSPNDGAVTTDIPAGSYDLAVTPNGLPTVVAIDLTGTTFEAGVNYFVAAMGTPDEPMVLVIPTEQ